MTMTMDNDGVGALRAGFEIDDATINYDQHAEGGSTQVDRAVRLAGGLNKIVELVGDGEGILGILRLVEGDGGATVQVGGFARAMGGDGPLDAGTMKKLVGSTRSGEKGYIREVDYTDPTELAVARGFAVDVSDADNVQIFLG